MFKKIKSKIRLYKYIIGVSENEVFSYTDDLKNNIELLNSNDDVVVTDKMMKIRKNYLEKVFRIVLELISKEKVDIYNDIEKIIKNPEICGYKDINLEEGALAGSIYAICYYAMTKK